MILLVLGRAESSAVDGLDRAPLHGHRRHVDADGLEVALNQLHHRWRPHVAAAAGRIRDSDAYAAAVAGLGQQLLRFGRIVAIALSHLRVEPRMAWVHPLVRRGGAVIEQRVAHAVFVDRVLQRLAGFRIVERFDVAVEHQDNRMRVLLEQDLEIVGLQLLDRVWRRHLRPVDLARVERGQPRVRLRHRVTA